MDGFLCKGGGGDVNGGYGFPGCGYGLGFCVVGCEGEEGGAASGHADGLVGFAFEVVSEAG